MQNQINGLVSNGSTNESGERYLESVKEYLKQLDEIIAWCCTKVRDLKKGDYEAILDGAKFDQVLDEYVRCDKILTETGEFSHVTVQCRVDGQEFIDNEEGLSKEVRDEVSVLLETMMKSYDELKLLANERIEKLRNIIEEKQQTQIQQFEEWLTWIEKQLANLTSCGADCISVRGRLKEMDNLSAMLEKQQEILNFISKIVSIRFEDINPSSLQIKSRSSSTSDLKLDSKLEDINSRWQDVCQMVEDRRNTLMQADSTWNILNVQGLMFENSLKALDNNLKEMFEMANNIIDTQTDKVFFEKLKARSVKINEEIIRLQSFYTRLEEKVKLEIEKIQHPNDELSSMLVYELSSKLDYMQCDWDKMMNGKRKLDYDLQCLENPIQDHVNYGMIPLPDPITSTSRNDLRFSNLATTNEHVKISQMPIRDLTIESLNNSSLSDGRDLINPENGSYSANKDFDTSISSETRSLLYGSNLQQERYINHNGESQEELSTTSLTASYPLHSTSMVEEDNSNSYPHHDEGSNYISNHLQQRLHLSNHKIDCVDAHNEEMHSCRVEEWKDSLESFSNWLKQVETSLNIPSALDNIVGSDSNRQNQCYFRLNPYQQLLLLNEIENRITSTCQDEFDCLILQGHEIIEDLVPEIGENDYETNSNKLRAILSEIELRYATVKKCLHERTQEFADKVRWIELLEKLQHTCSYLISQLDEVIPETEIGVDMITLAQQQDQLMHVKKDLNENIMIRSCVSDADTFLKICDFLQTQLANQSASTMSMNQIRQDSTNELSINNNIWSSFKNLKEDIEKQRDSLLIHCSELSHIVEERLKRLDEVHKEMHSLQHKMQELAARLQVAEILKSNWVPVENLTIEQLSEQLEDLKLFRERISEIESIHQSMNSIFDWMTDLDVPVSQQNLKRLNDLNDVWNLIQVSVEERQKLIEQAFDNQGASEQKFLNETVSDLPRWERKVATSKVPYFIDHETGKTHWDHPKFDELLKIMSGAKQYIFSAYRTAHKLRLVQRKLGIDMLMLEQLKEILDSSNSISSEVRAPPTNNDTTSNQLANSETLVGVEQIILILKAIFEKIQTEEKASLNVPLSIDLTLNWLLNLYDSTRTGYISVLSLKVGLALICCATREEKYIYMYELVSNQRTGYVDARKLGTLFETCMRIPIYLGEGESFGGSEIIEISIRNCFSMSKYNPQNLNSIDLADYLNWLKSEPQFIIWLPVLHRFLISENINHQVRCKLCGANPIIGLRYRCLKCFKFNICQNCFLIGRHIYEHFDPAKHPMQEYCCTTSSGENVKDFTKILRNKLKPRPFFQNSTSSS